MSLYSDNEPAWQNIAAKGGAKLAEMAKYFTTPRDMEHALGYTGSTIHKWITGRNNHGEHSELLASRWIAANVGNAKPVAEMPQVPAKDTGQTVLMVICDPAKMDKVQRVLGLMGCEVVEV